ncbi:hypothetical protein SDC9_49166 [bioreactor metagenome]|uniref:Putative zinc-finger domain-containing protein n=1 Tax=bioreactor metagenome TaxID=1076179 RepID=A0A644WHD2_9ZZZZ
MADCERILDLLSAKIDGELSQAEEAKLAAHLEHCESCRLLAAELESIHAGLQSFAVPPPSGLTGSILGKMKEENNSRAEEKIVTLPPRRHTWRMWLSMAAAFLFIAAGIRFLPLAGIGGASSGSSMSVPSVPVPAPTVSDSQEKAFGSENTAENGALGSDSSAGSENTAENGALGSDSSAMEKETTAGGADTGSKYAASRSTVSDTAGAGAAPSEAPKSPEDSTATSDISENASENDGNPENEMTFQAISGGSRGEALTAQNAAQALLLFLYPEVEVNFAELTDEEGNFTGLSVSDQTGNSLCTLEYQGETEDSSAFLFQATKEGTEKSTLWQVTVTGGEVTEVLK